MVAVIATLSINSQSQEWEADQQIPFGIFLVDPVQITYSCLTIIHFHQATPQIEITQSKISSLVVV